MEKKDNWIWWLIALIFACTITGIVVHKYGEKVDKLFHNESTEEVSCSEDTIYEEVPTIEDVLELRKDIKEYKRIDSVFLAMPEIVLIDILMNHGTELSTQEIVSIYESNPKTYNAVMSGARSQKFKEQIEPDTIPKKPEPEQQLK